MTEPMAADDICEHHYETRILGGRPITVRACIFCRTPDWADLGEQATALYRWGWEEGRDGKAARETLSAYDKPREEPEASRAIDDYEATTGHVITCTAAFADICDYPQDGPHAPHSGPERPDVGAEAADGGNGAQAGAGGRDPYRQLLARLQEERARALRNAPRCTIDEARWANEGIAAGIRIAEAWAVTLHEGHDARLAYLAAEGAGSYAHRAEEAEQHRDRLAATLAEVLDEFRIPEHPGDSCVRTDGIPCTRVEQWRSVLKPAHDDGPTVTEAANQTPT
ncbi:MULTISPECIES: hypothetical protein [Streptomyces]|uniref:Uncharacterized protein n=1 Tax=Streptomyces dengpaensis TaxID=2049881 RepID=A0ABM6SYL0_9ACTN|nr:MULTISPECIES: hypothetical protein [Streptomyces]AVH59965.1 hypothetical protein C4B68_33990 [Streptomyces dengpaensis]PIB09600.1 hypothetical protein B1C81_10665 [Streptomyces sp. HG99]